MQRNRDFALSGSPKRAYERRPRAWVEPIGDWGDGAVALGGNSASTEINDQHRSLLASRAADTGERR